jgi:hypothetical protein
MVIPSFTTMEPFRLATQEGDMKATKLWFGNGYKMLYKFNDDIRRDSC